LNLVGELSTRSDEFRTRWGAHNVRHHGSGAKTYHHPIVGELTLAYEGLELAADPGLTLTIYTAEPGSPSEEALRRSPHGPPHRRRPPTPRRSLRNDATHKKRTTTGQGTVGPGRG
jgi:hypothetical protein